MDEHIATITACMDQVLAGREISREQAETLFAAGKEEPFFLMAAADKIRKTFCGDQMRFCSDVNARSGRCTENCRFCAQSGWYHTGVKEYPLRSRRICSTKPNRQRPMAQNASASSPPAAGRAIPCSLRPS